MRPAIFILLACLLEMNNASHVYQCWDGSWQETCPSSEGEALVFFLTFGLGFFLVVVVMVSIFCTNDPYMGYYDYYGYNNPYNYAYNYPIARVQPATTVIDAGSRVRNLEVENENLRRQVEKLTAA